MAQVEKERFFTMAETYDEMAQILVPEYDFLQSEALRIVDFETDKTFTAVDLGAGSGILIEKILNHFPGANCIWVDYSDDFLRIAEKRLSKYGNRVKFVLSVIEDNWEDKIDCRPDLITSMSAIHHLETEEKKKLYNKCYDVLNTEGWFFNIDEMKTISDAAYKNSLVRWVNFVLQQEKSIPAGKAGYYRKFRSHFDNWKIRNIDNIEIPKQKGDDLHEAFIDQVKWLLDAGFKNADVFLKYHLWSVIGGQK